MQENDDALKELTNLNDKWVVYPDVELTTDDLKKHSDVTLPPSTDNEQTNTDQSVPEVPKELTDEEKHELFIKQLKESKIKFKSVKQKGNKTTNQFNAAYKKNRKRKNKLQRKSRKKNH
jgi:hypothetical protein